MGNAPFVHTGAGETRSYDQFAAFAGRLRFAIHVRYAFRIVAHRIPAELPIEHVIYRDEPPRRDVRMWLDRLD